MRAVVSIKWNRLDLLEGDIYRVLQESNDQWLLLMKAVTSVDFQTVVYIGTACQLDMALALIELYQVQYCNLKT